MNHEVHISTSHGHFDILIDDDLVSAMGVERKNFETTKLFVSSFLYLLSDSPLDPMNKPPRVYRRFIEILKRDGLKKVVIGFSELAHKLVSLHSLMGSLPERGEWIGDLFLETPVFFEYHRYHDSGDPHILEFLYTFLNFGKKLDYVDEAFNEAAFRSWEGIERKLEHHLYRENDLQNMKTILCTLLPAFSLDSFWPKFGPGSVSERGVRGRNEKVSHLTRSNLCDTYFFPSTERKFGPLREDIIPDIELWNQGEPELQHTARLKFVPKNLKVARSICMEPNTLMFFQQAVLQSMLTLIDASPFHRFIDIKDQSINRRLAEQGSYTAEVDTIDLSAASDSVSSYLVRNIFPETWLPPMFSTRSDSVIVPDGSIRKLNKFAPMGSALCFPTQCLIFASACIYAGYQYRMQGASPHEHQLVMTRRDVLDTIDKFNGYSTPISFANLAIYGDDICCDQKITPHVMAILDRLGFSVNKEKSFTGSQSFRESCGGFYLSGDDITPLYFRVKGVKARMLSAQHVASQVHLINEALNRGHINMRRFLIETLRKWYGGRMPPIPFLRDDSSYFGIKVPGVPYNAHLRSRYSRYQRTELKGWSISYDSSVAPTNVDATEHYEYMRWFASRDGKETSADSQAVSRRDTDGASLRWRWIPAS